MSAQPFFMVYVEGQSSPAYKHENLNSAEAEAKRLAKTLGRKAYVLCSIKSFALIDFVIEDCRPETDGDIPF